MNLRVFKKDIEYFVGEFIDDCALFVALNPHKNADDIAQVIDEAVAPDCTNTGLTAGVKCSECGEVIKAPVEITVTQIEINNQNNIVKSLANFQ